MLPLEHPAILSTFIKLQFVIKIFALFIFEWPFNTGVTINSSGPFRNVLPIYVIWGICKRCRCHRTSEQGLHGLLIQNGVLKFPKIGNIAQKP